jgi:hypothetical protein
LKKSLSLKKSTVDVKTLISLLPIESSLNLNSESTMEECMVVLETLIVPDRLVECEINKSYLLHSSIVAQLYSGNPLLPLSKYLTARFSAVSKELLDAEDSISMSSLIAILPSNQKTLLEADFTMSDFIEVLRSHLSLDELSISDLQITYGLYAALDVAMYCGDSLAPSFDISMLGFNKVYPFMD